MTGAHSKLNWYILTHGRLESEKRKRNPNGDTLRAFGVAAVSSTMLWALILVATGVI